MSITGDLRGGAGVDGLVRAGRRRLVVLVAVSLYDKTKRTIMVLSISKLTEHRTCTLIVRFVN